MANTNDVKNWSRRGFLLAGASATGLVLLGVGCKKNLSCEDTSMLTDAERNTRVTLSYHDVAEDPQKPCDGCRFFQGGQTTGEAQCGGCTVVKGPIHPKGGCKAWAKKDA